MENGTMASKEPIAIIGMAARFPGDARTVDDLWNVLMQGRHQKSEFPPDRINQHAHYHPDPEHGGTVCTMLLSF